MKATAPIFDRATALELADGDEELLLELSNLFLQEGGRQAEAVRQALDEGDVERVWRAAHTLAGSLSSLGAGRVAESAHRVEEYGRSNQIREAAAEFEVLQSLLTLLHAALADLTVGQSPALQGRSGGAS